MEGYYIQKHTFKRLTNDEILDCIERGDIESVVTSCVPYINSVAYKMSVNKNYVEFDDLMQVGLIECAACTKKFDPSKGFKFTSYAFTSIWMKCNLYVLSEEMYYYPGVTRGDRTNFEERKLYRLDMEMINSKEEDCSLLDLTNSDDNTERDAINRTTIDEAIRYLERKKDNNKMGNIMYEAALMYKKTYGEARHIDISNKLGLERSYVSRIIDRMKKELREEFK